MTDRSCHGLNVILGAELESSKISTKARRVFWSGVIGGSLIGATLGAFFVKSHRVLGTLGGTVGGLLVGTKIAMTYAESAYGDEFREAKRKERLAAPVK